jgi:ribokinase
MESDEMADGLSVPQVTVFGSAHEDIVLGVDRFPLTGETVVARSSERLFGGKGANQAVSAARAGASVTFVGIVGSDEAGTRVINNLASRGVDVSNIRRSHNAHTGLGIITVDQRGSNQIVVASGASGTVDEDFVNTELDAITPESILVLQCELPINAVIRAIHRGAESGARVILNLAPFAALPEATLRLVSVIILNEVEAASLTEAPADAVPELTATEIAMRTGADTIITLGARGSVFAGHEGTVTRIPARAVIDVTDTTGAGDAFVGAIAAGLARGMGAVEAMQEASAAAAHVVRFRGAQPPPAELSSAQPA